MSAAFFRRTASHTGRRRALCAATAVLLVLSALLIALTQEKVIKIFDWETGEVYVECEVAAGDQIYVGWTHSLEKIPWNEYYTVRGDDVLVLNSINFPAFGAGIPENKGTTHVRDGLIYMEDIEQEFPYFKWLNSQYTREICVNGEPIARGTDLPDHRILILKIERRGLPWQNISQPSRY